MPIFLIYAIFLVAFFANSLVGYNFIPPHVTVITEVSVYLLFVYSLLVKPPQRKGYRIHLLPLFCFFLLVAFSSMVINNIYSFRPVFSLRLILRFYVFYLALINLGLKEGQLKKVNTLIFFLFIIQLPASAIKFYFYGISEMTMGTYTVHGGGLTTVIPVVAIGYLTAYYVHFRKNQWLVILGVGFILYGVVGSKAALLYIYPVVFFGLYYLNVIKGKRANILRVSLSLIVITLCSVIVAATIMKYQPRMNKERAIGGSVDFKYALEYSKKYTSSIQEDEQFASGRLSTTKLVISTMAEGNIGNMVIGFGPGTFSKSIFSKDGYVDSRLARVEGSYGITGLAFFLIEFGWIGALCIVAVIVVFIILCWKWLNVERDPYWMAFAYGSFVFSVYFLFIFVCYNKLPILDDTITPVFYYAMAVVFCRFNAQKIDETKLTG